MPAFIVMLVSALGGPMLMFLALLLVIAAAILSVIVTYRYRLAVYFLLDNPDMGALAAITESKRAMVGWKGELFIQDLSFLGWSLLFGFAAALVGSLGLIFGPGAVSLLTILATTAFSLWLTPYMWGTEANFYDWVVHGRYSYRDSAGPDAGYQSPYSNFWSRTNIPALRSEGRDVLYSGKGQSGRMLSALQGGSSRPRSCSPLLLQDGAASGARYQFGIPGQVAGLVRPHGRPQPPTRAPMGIKSARRK